VRIAGYLGVKTVALEEEYTMERMGKLVEESHIQQSSTEKFVQKFAKHYTRGL